MAVNMKMTDCWDVTLSRLSETDQHFRCAHCLHQGDDGGGTSISEKLVSFCETIPCNIPEHMHLLVADIINFLGITYSIFLNTPPLNKSRTPFSRSKFF
jgi:hypothetical protein